MVTKIVSFLNCSHLMFLMYQSSYLIFSKSHPSFRKCVTESWLATPSDCYSLNVSRVSIVCIV
ncbi:hypothetical protein COL72_11350 [Bacillus toyonensis]|nr:hypothetical protein COL72_11350 [Bacillus toyonensis]